MNKEKTPLSEKVDIGENTCDVPDIKQALKDIHKDPRISKPFIKYGDFCRVMLEYIGRPLLPGSLADEEPLTGHFYHGKEGKK